MKIDVLVVGAGLAGTVLARSAQLRGLRVCVVHADSPHPTASQIAAGLFNPITGRRMSLTWLASDLFPYLTDFYTDFEETLQQRFFYLKPIYRPFDSLKAQNDWISQTADADMDQWLDVVWPPNTLWSDAIQDPLGGILIKRGGFLDIQSMLAAYRDLLKKQFSWIEARFATQDLEFLKDEIRWKGISTKQVVLCRGEAEQHLDFGFLPFSVVKGDILDVEIPQEQRFEGILNRNGWLFEHKEGIYKLGSTYEHQDLSAEPREAAKVKLLKQISGFWKADVLVKKHQCALRPATSDRRPFLGQHPQQSRLWVFNGLGSKGSSLAPYFAKHLLDVLFENHALIKEVDIQRFV
ncbi:MAG: FAD-binding oxidoreductase [Cytophagales bacterium]|nr:MAG: FAD-binding oxidoreductase [Cytophagales bacterium]